MPLVNRFFLNSHMKTWNCRKTRIKNVSQRCPYVDTETETSLYKVCSGSTPNDRIRYKCKICQKSVFTRETLRHHLHIHAKQRESVDKLKNCVYSEPSIQNIAEAIVRVGAKTDLELSELTEIHQHKITLDVYDAIIE